MINIHARVKHLVYKYNTRNPEKLAKELNITVLKHPLSPITKGFFTKKLGKKFIVINSNLDDDSQRIVLAHELGHALLHSSKDVYFIREHTLFPKGRHENEANKFAAELLIDDQDIDKHCLCNLSIDQLSCYFEVPKELIEYKFNNKILF